MYQVLIQNIFPFHLKSVELAPAVSTELLECTWKKAEQLLNTAGSICKAPGMSNAMCVASDTGVRPHIVSRNKNGDLLCDNECLAWKSKKLCSHVLAIAEEWRCLDQFLSWHKLMKLYCGDQPKKLVKSQVIKRAHLSTKSQMLKHT